MTNSDVKDFYSAGFIAYAHWRSHMIERINMAARSPDNAATQGVLSVIVFEAVELELHEIYNALILAEIGDALLG